MDAAAAGAALGRQAVIFAAGDGETAGAGDAVAAIVAGAADTTGEMVVAVQRQRHVAFRSEGGTGVCLDVHVVQRDLDLIVPGVDGHGVGRSFVLVLICDDGVFIVVNRIFAGLLHLVGAGLSTRRNRDVTILDVPCPCKGRGGKGGEHCGGQDKRRCPLRGRTGRIDTPPRMKGTTQNTHRKLTIRQHTKTSFEC